MIAPNIQYVLDERGKQTGVIVPINMWKEIISGKETTYLLKSKTMRKRLLEAMSRQDTIPFEVVREELGI